MELNHRSLGVLSVFSKIAQRNIRLEPKDIVHKEQSKMMIVHK